MKSHEKIREYSRFLIEGSVPMLLSFQNCGKQVHCDFSWPIFVYVGLFLFSFPFCLIVLKGCALKRENKGIPHLLSTGRKTEHRTKQFHFKMCFKGCDVYLTSYTVVFDSTAGQRSVSRKSRNFTGAFRVTWSSLYHETKASRDTKLRDRKSVV